jgi:hypothetical protein
LVVVLLLTSRFAVAEPTLDEAVAHAAQANKPLIVELYADWCVPCHVFEERVLARADVKRALATVEFVRYDIDRPVGGYIADRFNTTGVPAFLLSDGAGKELTRHLGGYSATEFLALIARATGARTLTSRLEAAVIEHPSDMAARMALATHYLEIGRREDARVQLGLVVDGPDRQLAAVAFATRAQVDLAEQRISAALDAAMEVVTRFPDTAEASMPLAVIGLARRIDRERVHELLEKHLAAVPDEAFDDAARVAIILEHVPLARAALAQRPSLRHAAVIDAELTLASESRDVAAKKIAAACREPGDDYACFLLEDALATRYGVTAATRRLGVEAKRATDSLAMSPMTPPALTGIELLAREPRAFRNSIAAALRGARQRCAHEADTNESVAIRLRFAAGKLESVAVRGKGDLQTCLRRAPHGRTAARGRRWTAISFLGARVVRPR